LLEEEQNSVMFVCTHCACSVRDMGSFYAKVEGSGHVVSLVARLYDDINVFVPDRAM
jgi:hypothetical protein